MAKSIHKFEAEQGNLNDAAPSGFFWEHWFDTQAVANSVSRIVDEHRIWEKAVSIAILAMDKAKR